MNKNKITGIISIALCAVIALVLIIALIPTESEKNNPFLVGEGELPMIAAHRGGGYSNPENTMLAFREAVYTYGVDIIESDLYLTKDGHLVYNHDSYIDQTCNVNGDISRTEVDILCSNTANRHYIKDMTLEELKQYNFGYYFRASDGSYPYRDVSDLGTAGVEIATAEQLFAEFYLTHPDLLFIIEIKNSGERGKAACESLGTILEKYPEYKDNVVVSSFHADVEHEIKKNYPDLMRGASLFSAASFIITEQMGISCLDGAGYDCLQLPVGYDVGIQIRFDLEQYVKKAHERNIAVQYWTINDETTMRRLIELGCDAITTDNPALLAKVLEDYRK